MENHFSIAEPEYIVQSIVGGNVAGYDESAGSTWGWARIIWNIPKNPGDLLGLEHTQFQKTYLETKGFQHKFD